MKKNPLIAYYLIAILIAWLGWAPLVLGSRGVSAFQSPFFQVLLILPAVSPMLAAVIVTGQVEGRQAAKSLPGRLFHWRVNKPWVLVALTLPILLLFLGKWITGWLGLSGKQMLTQDNLIATFISALIMALVANPWEEVGWRGFVLPRLQKRYNALMASLVVGVMWAFWHLPLFFWLDNPMSGQSFWLFLIDTMGVACIYTWLYNSSKGSLFLVALYHIAWNTFGAIITGVSEEVMLVETWLVVSILIILYGMKTLSSAKEQGRDAL